MHFITAVAALAGLASANVIAIAGVSVNAEAGIQTATYAHANVDAQVNLDAARKQYSGYKCPKSMSYCPWTKACSCPPGQKLDLNANICVGAALQGAWPEPDIHAYADVKVELGTYCAISPYKIVKYNSKHRYCQAGLDTITFCASVDIGVEIEGKAEIDIHAGVSEHLKSVCGGLSGLYLESIVDAAVLFNTDSYGLGCSLFDVKAYVDVNLLIAGLVGGWSNWLCKFGWGKCQYDCVSRCTKGCKNYVDVVGEVGGHIGGLVGLCIVDKVIFTIGATKAIVANVVDSLLCLVGGIIKTVLSTYNCNCH